jgi:MbtH protein
LVQGPTIDKREEIVEQDQAIQTFDVVINDEEQYSIWPVDRPIPAGWRAVDVRGTEETCLAYIEEHWTDMRPRSVRLAMQASESASESSGSGT